MTECGEHFFTDRRIVMPRRSLLTRKETPAHFSCSCRRCGFKWKEERRHE